jgi:hypothetical protein
MGAGEVSTIRSKTPCSTVVRRKYEEEVKEVRRELDTDGRGFEKTTGRGAQQAKSRYPASGTRRAGTARIQGRPHAHQPNRSPPLWWNQDGFFASGLSNQEHAYGTRVRPVSAAHITSINAPARCCPSRLSCPPRPVHRHPVVASDTVGLYRSAPRTNTRRKAFCSRRGRLWATWTSRAGAIHLSSTPARIIALELLR